MKFVESRNEIMSKQGLSDYSQYVMEYTADVQRVLSGDTLNLRPDSYGGQGTRRNDGKMSPFSDSNKLSKVMQPYHVKTQIKKVGD
jgi:hypothetical protein